MSRKIVNIVMFFLAVAYTIFVAVHLVAAISSRLCDDRMTCILSYGAGTICGLALIFAIVRYFYKRQPKATK